MSCVWMAMLVLELLIWWRHDEVNSALIANTLSEWHAPLPLSEWGARHIDSVRVARQPLEWEYEVLHPVLAFLILPGATLTITWLWFGARRGNSP